MLNQKRIDNEISKLMQIKDATKKQLIQLKSNAPEGSTLRAAIHGESVQYYIRTGGQDKCGTYIKKKDRAYAKMLAQIEYKPIKLSGNRIVHPDFTLLNMVNRKELYWEHFGMMDDIEYRNNAFNKIRDYESNGYYQGVNFIWTMETGKLPISTKAVDCMVSNMYIH